jgi:two-component sensor histidine kinase
MSAPDPFETTAMLLAEQQHRTRNAFQMVGGLLSREAAALDGAAALALIRAEAQIQAFALLNDALHGMEASHDAPKQPCLATYLRQLAAHLDRACLAPRGIALMLDLHEELPAAERTCRHIGLATSELVINAAKHAFEDHGGPALGIASDARDGVIRVAVIDNGCGMNLADTGQHRGLGYIEMLMRVVGGGCACRSSSEGTRLVLSVPA